MIGGDEREKDGEFYDDVDQPITNNEDEEEKEES